MNVTDGSVRIETTTWRPLPAGRAPARPLFAIGDIHGYPAPLAALQEVVRDCATEAYRHVSIDVVYLGDYVDRGPDPLGVLDLLGRGCGAATATETLLLGNHDWFLAAAAGVHGWALTDVEMRAWLRHGGVETLRALDLPADRTPPRDAVRAKLQIHNLALLEAMRLYMQSGRIYCVHAGVDPTTALAEQERRTLLWIREPFLSGGSGSWMHDVTVVHGHSPAAFGVHSHRIGVDSGGYESGVFSMAELASGRVRFHRATLQTQSRWRRAH